MLLEPWNFGSGSVTELYYSPNPELHHGFGPSKTADSWRVPQHGPGIFHEVTVWAVATPVSSVGWSSPRRDFRRFSKGIPRDPALLLSCSGQGRMEIFGWNMLHIWIYFTLPEYINVCIYIHIMCIYKNIHTHNVYIYMDIVIYIYVYI